MELEIKRDENTINDIAENIELVSNTNMVTKGELLQKFVAEDLIKNKMITVGLISSSSWLVSLNSNGFISPYFLISLIFCGIFDNF